MDKMHIQKTYSTARIEIANFFIQEGWLSVSWCNAIRLLLKPRPL